MHIKYIKHTWIVLIITIISFLLLEASSRIYLFYISSRLANSKSASNYWDFQKTDNGTIIPSSIEVLPIKQNLRKQWIDGEFAVDVNTNKNGFREDFEFDQSKINYAFFGDSFTFGHGVNAKERYSNIFALKLETNKKGFKNEAASFSWKNGFQPEHYEFWLKNNPNFKPRLLFVGLYLGNDLYSDVNETKYIPDQNFLELPSRKISPEGFLINNPDIYKYKLGLLTQYSKFIKVLLQLIGQTSFRDLIFSELHEKPFTLNPIELDLGKIDISNNRAIESLKRINNIALRRDSKLIILLIPQNFYFYDGRHMQFHADLDLKNHFNELAKTGGLLKQIVNLCIKENLTCIDFSKELSSDDYYAFDGHWNDKGHYKIGELLYKNLMSNKFLNF